MKLKAAMILGRFCGLDTVEECVLNIEMHSLNMFVYSDIPGQLQELRAEYNLWKEGDLKLDFAEIDAKVEQQLGEYMKSEEARVTRKYPEPLVI